MKVVGDRLGQVWLARANSIILEFEPYVVLREMCFDLQCVGWYMRPLERIADKKEEIGFYESQFLIIEAGRDDAWLKMRLS